MNHRVSNFLLLSSSCLVLSLSIAGCDDGIGVHHVIMRAEPDGMPEYGGGGCMLVSNVEGLGGGGGSGPEYAMEMATKSGEAVYRYFIAPEGTMLDFVTPANGELVAQVEADMDFFASGETKHIAFETYDGVAFEVFLWGEPDCEGDLPMGPLPGWE
jgi:hypothetical protein